MTGSKDELPTAEIVEAPMDAHKKSKNVSTEEVPLEGAEHVQVKHPLEHTWSFWMYTNSNKKKWEENLVNLTNFSTVEDYWCLYHHMKTPSELSLGQDYAVFKDGIQPKWEDPRNEKGGRWVFTLEKRRGDLDWMWLDVVLLLIGENFENNDLICGAVVNVRARCKISVWTGSHTNQQAIIEVGTKLKEQLGLGNGRLGYQIHDSNKNLYTL